MMGTPAKQHISKLTADPTTQTDSRNHWVQKSIEEGP